MEVEEFDSFDHMSKLTRTIIIFMIIVFALIISASFIISYPRTIKSDIVITSSPPPTLIKSNSRGYLSIFAVENSNIIKGEILGSLNSHVDLERIDLLEAFLDLPIENFHDLILIDSISKFELGFINESLNEFIGVLQDYKLYSIKNDHIQNIKLIQQELKVLDKQRALLIRNLDMMTLESKIQSQKLQRDSVLFEQKVISKESYEEAQIRTLQFFNRLSNLKLSIEQNDHQIINKKAEINLLNQNFNEVIGDKRLRLENIKRQLLYSIKVWKKENLVISPSNGILSYINIWDNKFINVNEQLFYIWSDSSKLIGLMEIPELNSSEVEKGLKVLVTAHNVDKSEYGYLIGYVEKVSRQPFEKKYNVTVWFPNEMVTTYGKKLPVNLNMGGSAEILLNEESLFQKFYRNLYNVKN